MFRGRFLLLLAIAAIGSPAGAVSLGNASTFNAFIFGSAYTPGGHSDGAVAVGGSWTMEYNTLMQPLYGVVGSQTKIGDYVGGALAVTNHPSVNNGGSVYVGGSYTGGINLNGGGSAYTGLGAVDTTIFTNALAYSLSLSSYLSSLGGQTIDTSDPNNWALDVSKIAGSMKVVSIDASKLSLLRTLNITGLTSSDTLVINVLGTTVSGFGVSVNVGSASQVGQILWNFADATYINISDRQFEGSILAPKAAVVQRMSIEGNLIAATWTTVGSPELHFGSNYTFRGNLQSEVPEPGALALGGALLAAGCAWGVARRRR